MVLFILLIFSLLCVASFGAASNKVDIEHSIDGKKFTPRGHLVLHAGLRETASKGLALSDDHDSLNEAFPNIESASAYRIRLPVMRVASGEIQTGGALQGQVDGYIPIANLKAACYAHEIHIYIDQLGTVYGLSVLPLNCANSTLNVPINVFQTESTVGPDTKGFLQKVEEERARKARQPVDNRSFFQKYWVYIVVGLFAFTLLSNAGGQAAGGEGQAQG